MASRINVSTSKLRELASNLSQLNAQFRTAVTELEDYEGRLNGMWDGEANNTFHNAFNNDKIQMTNFYNGIERYVQVLNDIANRYDQAEANNAEIASARNY